MTQMEENVLQRNVLHSGDYFPASYGVMIAMSLKYCAAATKHWPASSSVTRPPGKLPVVWPDFFDTQIIYFARFRGPDPARGP